MKFFCTALITYSIVFIVDIHKTSRTDSNMTNIVYASDFAAPYIKFLFKTNAPDTRCPLLYMNIQVELEEIITI